MPVSESLPSRLHHNRLNRGLSQRLITWGASAFMGLGTFLGGTSASFADIVSDSSTNSVVLFSDCLGLPCTIHGGETRGDNLFHSFSEFVIPPGGNAILSTPIPFIASDVERIFIRVVGSLTEVDGSFNVDDLFFVNSPDIFFLSPQGIRIGENARFSYPGSFLLSSAEKIDFSGGATFDATNSDPLLTLTGFENLPETLILGNSPGLVNFSNNSLTGRETIEIPQTQHQFSVIGGAINFDGVEISTPGKLDIASVGNNQAIGLNFQIDGIDFDYEAASTFQDIQLTNSNLSGRSFSSLDDAESIELTGKNLRLRQNSLLSTLTNTAGGDINIDFAGLVELDTASEISSRANTTSAIAGDISINSNEVRLAQGSPIVSFTTTDGGDINLDVVRSITLDSQSKIFTRTTIPTGKAGNISLFAARLELLAQNQISTSTDSSGGNIDLTIAGDISLENSSQISTLSSNPNTSGSNIDLNSSGQVTLDSFSTITTQATTPTASTGNIVISGNSLAIQDSSKIYSLTGDTGGDITLDFNSGGISLSNTVANTDNFIATRAVDTGNAGTLTLNAGNLSLSDQSQILSETGQGGGDLNFSLGGDLSLNTGSSIAPRAREGSGGSAGMLDLSGRNLTIDGENSLVFSLTENGGGDINLDLTNDISLSNGAQLGAFLTSNGDTINGDAGSILLQALNLSLNNDADIITETADGRGNIDIDLAGDLAVLGGNLGRSEIIAKLSTTKGAAGNISIAANDVTFAQGYLLTETDQPGGNINVNATNVIQFEDSLIRLSSPTGTGHTGNLSLASQSTIAPIGISLINTEVFNEATNTGGDVVFTAQGEVEMRDGSYISIDSSGANGNLTVAASAFRSSAIGADNDVLLDQGTLNNLSLPAEVTGFDLFAEQVVRMNANSELLPNPFPPPVAPPETATPPSPTVPPEPQPAPVIPSQPEPQAPVSSGIVPLDKNPIVEPLETPTSQPTPPETSNNAPPPYSEFRYLSSQTENFLTIQDLLAFYGAGQSSSNDVRPRSCVASGPSRFQISGRGGIGLPPSSLSGSSQSLADLGQVNGAEVSDNSINAPDALVQASDLSSPRREAQAWQQNANGSIELVAQADLVLDQPRMQGCDTLR